MSSVAFPITACVFSGLKRAYNHPLLDIQDHDLSVVKSAKFVLNLGKRSCVILAGIVSVIAAPIFLFIDCLYLVLRKFQSILDNKEGPAMDKTQQLLSFYRGTAPNTEKLFLDEILRWDDQKLEDVHNYIQWIFPTLSQSGPNPGAPTLNAQSCDAFKKEILLQQHLLKSFKRILAFYGLKMDESSFIITRADNIKTRTAVWLTPSNHNYSRITRIISCLKTLGFSTHAKAFYTIMEDIAQKEGKGIISEFSLNLWKKASR